MMSFPSGRCGDDAVIIQTNYQSTSVIVIHFMNGAGMCVLGYSKNFFNVYICLNINSRHKHKNAESKPKCKR